MIESSKNNEWFKTQNKMPIYLFFPFSIFFHHIVII